MDFIDIRVALSKDELGDDLYELRAFANRLTASYASRGVVFSLTEVGDEGVQDLPCRHLYVLVGGKASSRVEDAFSWGWKQFQATGAPRVHTYFRELAPGVSPAEGVRAFMERLDEGLGHYWSRYKHIDTVKLDILLEHECESSGAVKIEDGFAKLWDQDVLDLANVPLYALNESVSDLRSKLEGLDAEFAHLAPAAARDRSLRTQLMELEGTRGALRKRLHQAESDVLQLGVRATELVAGEAATWRVRAATQLLDAGDYAAARELLGDSVRAEEAAQAESLLDEGRRRMEGWLAEQSLLANTLLAEGRTDANVAQVDALYREAVDRARRMRVGLDILFEYSTFLSSVRRYRESADLCQEYIASLEGFQGAGDKVLRAFWQQGLMLTQLGAYEEAERTIQNTLDTVRQVDAYYGYANVEVRLSLAETLVDLGNLRQERQDFEGSLRAYQQAADLCHELMGQGSGDALPTLVNALANSANTLVLLGRASDALAYAERARELAAQLAGQDQQRYEATLAKCEQIRAWVLVKLGRMDEGISCLQGVLACYGRLAQREPAAYAYDEAFTSERLATAYYLAGRAEESLPLHERAATILWDLVRLDPAAHTPTLGWVLDLYGLALKDAGRFAQAAAVLAEAYDTVAADRYDPQDRAQQALDIASCYAQLEDCEHLVPWCQTCVDVLEPTGLRADKDKFLYARAVTLLSVALDQLGQNDQAAAAYEQAIAAWEALDTLDEGRWESFAVALENYAEFLQRTQGAWLRARRLRKRARTLRSGT